MLIYVGKYTWYNYAPNEVFVVLLPQGPPRVHDKIYLCSQWVTSTAGKPKGPFFWPLNITKAQVQANGDINFSVGKSYWSWSGTITGDHQKMDIKQFGNSGGEGISMALTCAYANDGGIDVLTDAFRVWTGKLSWYDNAHDEAFVVVVPHGLGKDKKILGFWQWTTDAAGVAKRNEFIEGTQNTQGEDESKFDFFTGYYTFHCSLEKITENLNVSMSSPSVDPPGVTLPAMRQQLKLSSHSHDFSPPEPITEKTTLDVSYPRLEPALERIQTQLPFPNTLIDALSHTAAYLDHAGYLAKYAQDRFAELDKYYHETGQTQRGLEQEVTALKQKASEDDSEKKKLSDEKEVAQQQIAQLTKALKDTQTEDAQQIAALNSKVDDLTGKLTARSEHDKQDHSTIDQLHEELKVEHTSSAALKRNLHSTEEELRKMNIHAELVKRDLARLKADYDRSVAELSEVKGTLRNIIDENTNLRKYVGIVWRHP